MIEHLRDIPRIGEKTAQRFIEHFGSEKKAIESIINGDIAGISEIEGMTEKSAISLVLEASTLNEGVGVRDFLKTDVAYGIYEHIRALISDFAHTDYAKSKIHLYFPYPSCKKDRIIKSQKEIGSIIELTDKLDDNELSGFLSRIKPVKVNFTIPVIRDRVIIAATQEEFEAAKNFPVSVQLVANQREVVDIARGYSHAIISTGFAGIDLPEDIDADFMDIRRAQAWEVVPEKELGFFARNLESISSAISVLRIIRRYNTDFCIKITHEEVERLALGLAKVSGDSDIKSGVDSDIDRLRSIYDHSSNVIADVEKQANVEFGSLIEKSSITVKGFDLLTAMDGSINRLLEKEIKEKYNTVTGNAIRAISSRLELNPKEAQYINNFFGDDVSYPVRVNSRGVDDFKNHLLRSITSRKLVILRDNARELSKLKESASVMVREVLDFDVGYTIGCFARAFNLNMPIIQSKNGIGFTGGTNLFLNNPVPIDYAVGASRFNAGAESKGARIILLSGVNSGGKTSAIDLLAQIIILAHMGFPVPAKQCELGLVEEFFYFGKSRGTMDAGAFESTIKDFSAVAGKKSKIVLADELESITEPGASARIISGILEELDENNGLGVFVSHLSEAILKSTACRVRVDGIEAKGLDEHLNLIVDRNPRYNYLARSTPELIVERLARKDRENEFYKRLLGKFR
ncbi:mismatch repair ATPase (MutS family) [Candidatus Methanoperedens nitroreducens]|uniref:DNA-binding protein MutS2 n=1 Tax=Candidatus Methanoperedens nitratireducens TaxID=1392998 RepID=A0A062V458_9EURY|nr:helix-hairpin-helix domain-containing protein [Candidatus Methanoperedens nitroreducens]KCZ70594.1 mismatch repair ATPase (MutS family) [Candidatus Methanoperedens nitroreducens]MDJ1420448.1 helix-hairpin-helix domain-containing protein [Candidatus Methanoperedens sp.]